MIRKLVGKAVSPFNFQHFNFGLACFPGFNASFFWLHVTHLTCDIFAGGFCFLRAFLNNTGPLVQPAAPLVFTPVTPVSGHAM